MHNNWKLDLAETMAVTAKTPENKARLLFYSATSLVEYYKINKTIFAPKHPRTKRFLITHELPPY
jgi:hypothetical protein